jgi:hypothetical protein
VIDQACERLRRARAASFAAHLSHRNFISTDEQDAFLEAMQRADVTDAGTRRVPIQQERIPGTSGSSSMGEALQPTYGYFAGSAGEETSLNSPEWLATQRRKERAMLFRIHASSRAATVRALLGDPKPQRRPDKAHGRLRVLEIDVETQTCGHVSYLDRRGTG